MFSEVRLSPHGLSAFSKRVCGLQNLGTGFRGVLPRCEHGRQVLGKMAAGKSRLAGGALGPREGHMTRLAARAAGAGKGEGGREEAWPVTCRRLRRPVVFSSVLAAA